MPRPPLALVFVFATGCGASTTAYRAHFESQAEVAGIRECAAQCDAASDRGRDVHQCLAACPGFSAHPGDRCGAGAELPGTYCVTVEDRIRPDAAFWLAAAEVATEVALEAAEKDEQPEDASEAPGKRTPARASARPARLAKRGKETRGAR